VKYAISSCAKKFLKKYHYIPVEQNIIKSSAEIIIVEHRLQFIDNFLGIFEAEFGPIQPVYGRAKEINEDIGVSVNWASIILY